MEPIEWIVGGAAVVWIWDRFWPAKKQSPKATPKPEPDDDD